jgi:hypothetical protein
MPACDIVITIRGQGRAYEVEFRAAVHETACAKPYHGFPVRMTRRLRDDLDQEWKVIQRSSIDDSDPRGSADRVGRLLFDTFVRPGIEESDLTDPEHRARIELHIDDPWLSGLPWEMLCHVVAGVARFLGNEGHSIVRGVAAVNGVRPP